MKKLSLVLLAITSAACAVDTGAPNVEGQTTNLSPTQPLSSECANPVPLDQVPETWQLTDGATLVNGGSGRYELVEVKLHAVFEKPSGEKNSASTTSKIELRDSADPLAGITQLIDCKKIADGDRLTLWVKPHDHFLVSDGSYNMRREIKFELTDKSTEKFMSAYTVDEPYKFGQDIVDPKTLEDLPEGATYDTRLYRVSDTEIEHRVTVTTPVPEDVEGGGTATLNSSLRYRFTE